MLFEAALPELLQVPWFAPPFVARSETIVHQRAIAVVTVVVRRLVQQIAVVDKVAAHAKTVVAKLVVEDVLDLPLRLRRIRDAVGVVRRSHVEADRRVQADVRNRSARPVRRRAGNAAALGHQIVQRVLAVRLLTFVVQLAAILVQHLVAHALR